MTRQLVRRPHFNRNSFLSLFISMSIAIPSVLGQQNTAHTAETPQITRTVLFAVATIKPSKGDNGWRLEFTPDGFTARGVMLRQVIQEAYGVYEEDRMYGGPAWLISGKFDIEAKIDSEDTAGWRDFGLDQRRLMLQKLLADRFSLVVHRETKELPVYALVVARNGPKLQESKPDTIYHSQIKGIDGLVTRSGRGLLEAQGLSMTALANLLHFSVGRTVVDQTGLQGRYDLSLHWTPDDASDAVPKTGEANQQEAASDFSGPSIFTAIQEQLGLKLRERKRPAEEFVIDRVEPSSSMKMDMPPKAPPATSSWRAMASSSRPL